MKPTYIKSCIVVLGLLLLGAVFFEEDISIAVNGNVSGERRIPIYCVDTDERKVALSFDAAWGNEDTKEILNILEKENVKVTFFMTGGWVKSFPDDVKAIAAAGHDLGNHSENHKQMSQISRDECVDEIMKVHDRVKELTGREMTLFRPPYGDYNNTLMSALDECGYYCIQWDVDSLDWKDYGVQSIIDTVVNHKHLGNGSIILCHNGAKFTAQALENMIKSLKAEGYEIVPISELIHKGEYHTNHEGRQISD
ncbi:MAG: polysaccharide deacetylase family protein [Lachnospiraceae bacterium]|nr:polysaccharide deacetylase family protein [Lachnospiraceae bacterium]